MVPIREKPAYQQIGNCDVCAELKILSMDETKRYEIWP
jgi:hypothetical protein